MARLQVELVAADREVWSGPATTVIARTVDGDLGILPGHAPLLSVLVDSVVTIRTPEGRGILAAVHGGFISVADDEVALLTEVAELAEEIDVARAEEDMRRAEAEGGETNEASAALLRRARLRLRAAELQRD